VITAPPPPVALAVSPPRLVVAAGETRAIRITNSGAAAADVEASATGYTVTLRGRPLVLARHVALILRPRRVTIPPGRTVTIAVAAGSATATAVGDRAATVLLTTAGAPAGVRVSLRVGVLVLLRGPGPLRHRIVVAGLRVRGPTLELALRNAGNVSERIAPSVLLYHGGRLVGTMHASPRELLPRSRGICAFRFGGRVRGRVTARVRVASAVHVFRIYLPGGARARARRVARARALRGDAFTSRPADRPGGAAPARERYRS
jgi:hypothetical protein